MDDSVYGVSVPRLEDERLLRGEARFVDDISLPDMLCSLKLLRFVQCLDYRFQQDMESKRYFQEDSSNQLHMKEQH